MITQILGRLVEKHPTHVVVDCNGIGYEINISLNTYSQLIEDEKIKLFTHLQIRDDTHTLFGFHTRVERSVFRLLISVSGVGVGAARTMLSSMEPVQIQKAIISEDVAVIKSIKGIGLKTAQRVILELKDKMLNLYDGDEVLATKNNTTKEEALSALEVLGYPRRQSEKVVDSAIQDKLDASVEEIIKGALNKL